MRVSVTWLGVGLILIILLGMIWQGKGVYETFTAEQNYKKEGFTGSLDDLQVSTCPANSKQFIDENGIVLCCDGTVSDNKCTGRTICSLSEGSAKYPTCSTWFAAYLNEKGRDRCPPSMPNYYESKDGKVKGCTAGRRNKEGSDPIQSSDSTCKLYSTQLADEREVDSCSNQQLLETTKCFSREIPNVTKRLQKVWWNNYAPSYVVCSYTEPGTTTVTECGTDDSWNRVVQRQIEKGDLARNWKQTVSEWDKVYFCSLTEKVKINKTLAFNDLKKTPTP
jgi:hypothetical protein